MKRKERKIIDQEIINKILSEFLICRIALFDDEHPYIVPMNYGFKDNALYFHCAIEGKKIDLIQKNNKVGFEIEDEHEILKFDESCKWTTKYRSIIGTGEIEIIRDYEEKVKGLDILMQQHGKQDNSYNSRHVDHILILKLNILSLSAKQAGDW